MFALCSSLDELKHLIENGRNLLVETKVLLDLVSANGTEVGAANLPRRLCNWKNKQTDFVKRLVRFKRTPATHIFVIMISSELRMSKPYALPVQCLSYTGMSEKDIRSLLLNLIGEMVKHGMVVRGM